MLAGVPDIPGLSTWVIYDAVLEITLPGSIQSTTIQLSGPTETRPAQTGGNSTATITAKVTSGGQPKAGVAVALALEVVENSGGHDHDSAARPKGKLTPSSGVTDANGEVKVIFQASQVAGEHIIAASCTGCQAAVSHDIKVKVPDLVDLFKLKFRGAFAYPGVGTTTQHISNHWLTWDAAYRMFEISRKYSTIWPNAPGKPPLRLTLNDMSLEWGGKFDIEGGWEARADEHGEHRLGQNVDIRANTLEGAIPKAIRPLVDRWFDKRSLRSDGIRPDLVIESVDSIWEYSEGNSKKEHFHLRLGN
jgi:hypothetical protein